MKSLCWQNCEVMSLVLICSAVMNSYAIDEYEKERTRGGLAALTYAFGKI